MGLIGILIRSVFVLSLLFAVLIRQNDNVSGKKIGASSGSAIKNVAKSLGIGKTAKTGFGGQNGFKQGSGGSGFGASSKSRTSLLGGGGSRTGSKSGGLLRKVTGSTAGKVAIGAAAGYFAAKLGSKIARGTARLFYPQHNRHYWMGQRYYHPSSYDKQRCVYAVSENSPDVNFNMQYEDGQRVREIVFECDRYTERCCGLDCCRQPTMYSSQGTAQHGTAWHKSSSSESFEHGR